MIFQSFVLLSTMYSLIVTSNTWTELAEPNTEYLHCNELLESETLKKADIIEFERTS